MNLSKRIAEFRATVKGLEEQRAELEEQLSAIVDGAKAETRALSADEQTSFGEIEGKINDIDKTIEAEVRARTLKLRTKPGVKDPESDEVLETRALESYMRNELNAETRTGEQNLTRGNNGAVIPVTIVNRVISKVTDICPIYAKAVIYHTKGKLRLPVYGKSGSDSDQDITVAYATEFNELTANVGKFTSVDLDGYLVGALSLIGLSVANNADIDVVSFVVDEMARNIAIFIEQEMLIGTANKSTGALSGTNTLTSANATSITGDDLIGLQAKVKQVYQKDACWTMHPDTFTAIKKLKGSDGKYLLQEDFSGEFPYRLLGKPVNVSYNMPTVVASAKSLLYGTYSGVAGHVRENISMQVLREKYATQHALGINAWFEFDCKIVDNQKLAILVQKAS